MSTPGLMALMGLAIAALVGLLVLMGMLLFGVAWVVRKLWAVKLDRATLLKRSCVFLVGETVIVAAVSVASSIPSLSSEALFAQEGYTSTQGEVSPERPQNIGFTYYITYQVDGVTYKTGIGRGGPLPSDVRVGDKRTVYYSPADPARCSLAEPTPANLEARTNNGITSASMFFTTIWAFLLLSFSLTRQKRLGS